MRINKAFFAPVVYDDSPKSIQQQLTETVDNFFYFGQKRLHISGTTGTLVDEKATFIQKCSFVFKAVISLLFPAVPVSFLIGKIALNPRDDLTHIYTQAVRAEVETETEAEFEAEVEAQPQEEPEQTVVKVADLEPQHLQCLAPGEWLNTFCMEAFMKVLIAKHKRGMTADTHPLLGSLLLRRNPYSVFIKSDLTRPTCFKDLSERIYIPLNISDAHWALCVLDLKRQKIHYYDSLFSTTGEKVESLRQNLNRLYEKEGKRSNWKVVVERCPRQNNSYDCGPHVCLMAERLMQRKALKFSSDDVSLYRELMRQWLEQALP